MARIEDGIEDVHNAATEMGMLDLKEDTRWWPEHECFRAASRRSHAKAPISRKCQGYW